MADLPDPSTLTDEELDKILNPQDEDNPDENQEQHDKDEEEEKPKDKEEPKEQEEDKPEEQEDKEEPEQRPPSRREQRRIKDLLQKYGDPEDPKPQPVKTSNQLDYEKELEAEPETIKRLQEDREKAAEAGYDRGFEQAKSIQWHTRLEIDAPRVDAKYPQLDQSSAQFKKEAADDVNGLYLALSGYDEKTQRVKNPDIRYIDFIDTIFGLVNDLADEKAAESTQQIKRQVAKTGLRPDGSSAKKLNLNKAPQDMTDEELDAYLKANNLA